ncbi:respiratory nitrate reductase subunit gamma [Sulfitobacter mediterraneus]|jgi:nitrate reductase gamma subunit|uniref:respiratory nitrate reductase subunit gamma n=1 Tax=Sulfitobacter TaxID=60136 RepID=UPI0019344EF8|nr:MULTISPECIES: respiratory nitrate reductase subunit gamma [Sulfitobacter]MBM1633595.1 respiratory nitrate reductase subunit gamma [Sulfitobacter mediterraneus]MBM1641890.1 respiratory nitrate reductase subunit gamma [Sulfitobacter mediterraneus]MBM1645459.1 respiratory nitrate reductase subunit gamma [Sulfitobacter mediterraneus]MBM1650009.1 respiratory nitrate reductase subunit gamma [Sulfitobacter mediterraneus]MBM1653528.1 respiratory nitrate reductase subunit gamma [Sulfitobacter medite
MFTNFDIDYFIFGIMPYIALTVLIVGCIARYERDPFTWKSSSSQLLRRKQLILGSVLFHVGILTVFFGHLAGLFTPVWILDALGIPYALKQWMAVVIGGIAGVTALIGATILLHRRLTDPRIRRHSSFADIGILALIWLQLLIGIGTIFLTLQHMDGAEMVRFMTWSQSVVLLNLNAWAMVVDVHWLYKAHIFLGLLITLLFPFTRLVHMVSAPIRYLWRPGYQVVRSRRQTPLPARNEGAK